jgi:hypothetical protein
MKSSGGEVLPSLRAFAVGRGAHLFLVVPTQGRDDAS